MQWQASYVQVDPYLEVYSFEIFIKRSAAAEWNRFKFASLLSRIIPVYVTARCMPSAAGLISRPGGITAVRIPKK